MRCSVSITREQGQIVARCDELPACEGRAVTRDEALGRLRRAIAFWIETCPCDVTAEAGLVLEVVRDDAGG